MSHDCGIDIQHENGEIHVDGLNEQEVVDLDDLSNIEDRDFSCWEDFEDYYTTRESCPIFERNMVLEEKDIDFLEVECMEDFVGITFENSGTREIEVTYLDVYI